MHINFMYRLSYGRGRKYDVVIFLIIAVVINIHNNNEKNCSKRLIMKKLLF